MKSTMLSLLKFECDNPKCLHECWVNRNNNMLTHYNADMSALLDWVCPECREGKLRYAASNTRFEFELRKHSKQQDVELADDEDDEIEGSGS